jgi:hypothetical protein
VGDWAGATILPYDGFEGGSLAGNRAVAGRAFAITLSLALTSPSSCSRRNHEITQGWREAPQN